MGSSVSSLMTKTLLSCSSSYSYSPPPPPPPHSTPSLGDLPEGCVALVLTHLDPLSICKYAKLNHAFKGASSADFVWESKLPSNYQLIVYKLFKNYPESLGLKKIYALLSRPNFYDDNTKEVWLDKRTGGVCLCIGSKGLGITCVDDRRYWKYLSAEESRFRSVAYLQQIWWLEAEGEVEFPLPTGTYSIFFRLQLGHTSKRFGRRVCNLEHVHGWDKKPVRFQVWTSDGQYESNQHFLQETGKWIDVHAGNFVVLNPNVSTKVKFSMTQIDCTHTKGGLCLDSVAIYPVQCRERLNNM